tara:strand:+ start:114 stop:452 length:339 start_codon:yes stop_codon:yes gene_type:complete
MAITKKNIEFALEKLNGLLGVPEAYEKDGQGNILRCPDGYMIQCEGHCYLQGAYGKFKIERMCKYGSADATHLGTKSEVYYQVLAMIEGIEAYQHSVSTRVGGVKIIDRNRG